MTAVFGAGCMDGGEKGVVLALAGASRPDVRAMGGGLDELRGVARWKVMRRPSH